MRRAILCLVYCLAFPVTGWAEDVKVEGCAVAGVEANCVMLEANGTKYNITAAMPKPDVGTYGMVSGVVSTDPDICQQGDIKLAPATWTPDSSKTCPLAQ